MPVIPTPKWSDFLALKRDRSFQSIIKRATQLKAQKKAAEEGLKHIAEELEPLLQVAGVKENMFITLPDVEIIDEDGNVQTLEGAKLAIMDRPSGSYVDAALLIQNGVKKSIIEKCTKEKKRAHFLDIRLPTEKTEEDMAEATPRRKARR